MNADESLNAKAEELANALGLTPMCAIGVAEMAEGQFLLVARRAHILLRKRVAIACAGKAGGIA